jgi:hypothetical protein
VLQIAIGIECVEQVRTDLPGPASRLGALNDLRPALGVEKCRLQVRPFGAKMVKIAEIRKTRLIAAERFQAMSRTRARLVASASPRSGLVSTSSARSLL